ncbi:hypothetical protein [Lacticaseibacillus pantheris]|uniref:hypothetical protein n=1 Tax=Lacticaseibacillus pantheris TaxID=171523 RepID=UPI0026580D32|nr:hypothetical protein [Lacticaseibacillus pantheris]WKF84841.1 hypothetical protein QY874_11260 [Lacticaseibacillus pantheris]
MAVLTGGGAVGYCDLVDRSTVTAAVAGRTGVVVPVERLVPATGAVNLTLTPVPGYRELP